ncbi:hypothetical protein BD410DRAFT_839955 [Rickenella mellea]|uniref:Association with the SNF1 complex (ASC) domain-containing protein n=1 Tax=Rickenella mellea TaxID=50990 RepID=A0A4Y7Q3C7_9AGAM|nr:hypothetical protein BD410DRAFT_839955 [Rickenella mellea]
MGNSSSANRPTQQHPLSSPSSRRSKSPHPNKHLSKKKSIELPDLATRTLSPANPQASSPIAIPIRSQIHPPPIAVQPAAHIPQVVAQARSHATAVAAAPTAVAAPPPPRPSHGTPPAPHTHHVNGSSGRGRGNPHIRGAPLTYTSTRDFGDRQPQPKPLTTRGKEHAGFIPYDVRSSLPVALPTAEKEREEEAIARGPSTSTARTSEERLTQVCVIWRGGAKSVELIRAGDNDWLGRQAMDYDESLNQWTAWVSLPPGTHHIRFVVDGIVSIASDLPTAVDDEGAIANYVSVPISGYTPPQTATVPPPTAIKKSTPPQSQSRGNSHLQSPSQQRAARALQSGDSFWHDTPPQALPKWTDEMPWQLEIAVAEEERWLNGGQVGEPPRHPRAQSLPRHLDKPIMNKPPPGMTARHTTRAPSRRGSQGSLGTPGPGTGPEGQQEGYRVSGTLPVTTASGTNLSQMSGVHALAGSGSGSSTRDGGGGGGREGGYAHTPNVSPRTDTMNLADDGSVLPVPSHTTLRHLGTTVIRTGVLAVCSTTRYKKKFITTVYYKPA